LGAGQIEGLEFLKGGLVDEQTPIACLWINQHPIHQRQWLIGREIEVEGDIHKYIGNHIAPFIVATYCRKNKEDKNK
jgi:hypothetical protein